MVAYIFGPKVALDPNTFERVESGTLQAYAVEDTAATTPLPLTGPTGDVLSGVRVTQNLTESFVVQDHPVVVLRSGSFAVPVDSPQGIIEDAEASRMAAESAALDAETSASAALAAQAAAEALEAGVADWGAIQNKPPAFPPSSHNHDASALTSGTVPLGRLSGVVKSVNGNAPDANGNIVVSGGGGTGGAVSSVANKTGDVSLVKSDVGLGNVDNTSDLAKEISTKTQVALNGKASTTHVHAIADVAGLSAALDSKRGRNDQIDASLITGTVPPNRLGSGTVSDPTRFLASDGMWRVPVGGSGGSGVLNEIVVYGDSQVSNDTVYGGTKRFGQLLAEEAVAPVSEQGYGGATTPAVVGTAGAAIVYVTLAGNTIPVSGTVAATAIENAESLQSEYDNHYGYIRGVRVRVTGGGYGQTRQFTRVMPGSAVHVPPGTAFVSERALAGMGRVAVVMSGGNDPGHGVSEAVQTAGYKAIARKFGNRAILVTSVRNTHYTDGAAFEDTEAALAAEFGDQYLNAREFLATRGAQWAGITLSAADQTRASNGWIPRAFYHTDNLHLNELARTVLARRVAQMLQASGFIEYAAPGSTLDNMAPSVPTSLSSSAITETSFTVSWASSTDNTGVAGYDVYLGGAYYGSTAGTSIAIGARTAGVAYSVTVRARDVAGNVSAASNPLSVTTTASSDTTAPSVPTGVNSAGVSSTGATITWNASTDNVGVTGYEVLVDGVVVPGTVATTTKAITSLSPETSYNVTVRARDAAGNWSAQSSTHVLTTSASGGGGGEVPFDTAFRFDVTEGDIVSGRVINLGSLGTSHALVTVSPSAPFGPDGVSAVSATEVGGVGYAYSASHRLTIASNTGSWVNTARPGMIAYAAVLLIPSGSGMIGNYNKLLQVTPGDAGGGDWAGYFGSTSAEPKTSMRGDSGEDVLTAWAPEEGTPFLFLATCDAGGNVQAWANGVPITGGNGSAWSSLTVATRFFVTGGLRVAELIADERRWTTSEASAMNSYLMGKYDIA